MGTLADFDGGMTHVNFNPLATLYLSNDHAVVTNFRPMGTKSTEVHLMWLVDGSARANVDYTVDEVAWDVDDNGTSGQDDHRKQSVRRELTALPAGTILANGTAA